MSNAGPSYAALHDDNSASTDYRSLYLKEDQWALLGQMVTVLKPLQVATMAICEAKFVSIALIYPVISGLLKKRLVTSDENLHVVKAFKEKVAGEIRRHFKPDNLDVTDSCSACLCS